MPENSKPLPLDPADFLPRFAAAARAAGFTGERFGTIDGAGLFAFKRSAGAGRPRVYLSAGIHGDEPAPPWTLLRLTAEGFFDDRCAWYLCPLLNPGGFQLRQRENSAAIDLNRDYRAPRSAEVSAHIAWLQQQPAFDLVVCVHEDWESAGFYLYELNPLARPSLAPAFLRGAGAHCPIEVATTIDGRAIDEPGIIRPDADPALRELWPEAIYLRQHHGTLQYTLESPSALPLEQRISTLRAAIRAALDEFLRDPV